MVRRRFLWAALLYVVLVSALGGAARAAPYPLNHTALAAARTLVVPAGVVAYLWPGLLGPLPVWAQVMPLAVVNAGLVWAASRQGPWRRRRIRAAEERLTWALTATGLPVTPMAHACGTRRDAPGLRRYEHSLLLRDVPVPYRELVGVYRNLWGGAGLAVQETAEPVGLRARDEAGFELRLAEGPGVFGDAVLLVASPPWRTHRILAGVLTGAALIAVALYLLPRWH